MNILHIDASILGENSVSRSLSAAHIAVWFGATPTDPAVIADLATGQAILDELFAADIIVIGAPMYNFTLPTQLKSWIDRILITGKTFKYNEQGAPVGLVPATKKVFIASTRGGQYTAGAPAAFLDHQETLLKGALGFIGLTDVTFIRAEGLAIPGQKEPAIAAAQATIAAIA
jgi:FMN-dependent NADH-azoreductase